MWNHVFYFSKNKCIMDLEESILQRHRHILLTLTFSWWFELWFLISQKQIPSALLCLWIKTNKSPAFCNSWGLHDTGRREKKKRKERGRGEFCLLCPNSMLFCTLPDVAYKSYQVACIAVSICPSHYMEPVAYLRMCGYVRFYHSFSGKTYGS